jgi:hypothetical protein
MYVRMWSLPLCVLCGSHHPSCVICMTSPEILAFFILGEQMLHVIKGLRERGWRGGVGGGRASLSTSFLRRKSWNKERKEYHAFLLSYDLGPPPPPRLLWTMHSLYNKPSTYFFFLTSYVPSTTPSWDDTSHLRCAL